VSRCTRYRYNNPLISVSEGRKEGGDHHLIHRLRFRLLAQVRACFRLITSLEPWTDRTVKLDVDLSAALPWFTASRRDVTLRNGREKGAFRGCSFRVRSYILRRLVPPPSRLPMLAHATAILDAWIVHRLFAVWRVMTRSCRCAREFSARQALAAFFHSWKRISKREERLRILAARSRARCVRELCWRCLRAVYRHASKQRLRRLQHAVILSRASWRSVLSPFLTFRLVYVVVVLHYDC